MARPYYAIQPAFTGGEISEDVASRVDLDKYQLALLQAENVIIRPYGSLKKRNGSAFCGETKNNGQVILKRFEFTSELSYLLEIGAGYIRIWRDGVYLGVEVATPFTASDLKNIRTVQSIDVMYICCGTQPVQKLMRYAENDWRMAEVGWVTPPYDDLNIEDTTIQPSATNGTVTLTASNDIFSNDDIGSFLKLEQYVSGSHVSISNGTSNAITCGTTWKVITHGTWTGSVEVQISYDDGTTWQMLRKYTSKGDYNPTESGSVEELAQVRIVASVSSGSLTADLSTYPYNNIGYGVITAVTDARTATMDVRKTLGSTEATDDWAFAAWSKKNGYPYTVTFFQDRLCFGGNKENPQRLWMSKSGDYENFSVEKEGGTVTDDSAIAAELLSLKSYKIEHLVAGSDLIIMTEGNTWTISGSETVKPSEISPRNQESYGANITIPVKVGNKIVYVQRRGSSVRDVGYAYDTDSYSGMDLTLLAKHLVRDTNITDGTYAQEPDSCIYYTQDNGHIVCLTYVPDQKVYAWSHFITDGIYETVESASENEKDKVYVVVKRQIDGVWKRYIEVFDTDKYTDVQQDYHMMDSYVTKTYNVPTTEIDGLEHLEGKKVHVLADNYYYDDKEYIVTDGKITLPQESLRVTVGLPYRMVVEQPNFDVGNTESGTIQGREKVISTAILRLVKSYGGSIGPVSSALNKIIYDPSRLETGQNILYSGDKEVVLGTGGYDKNGRVYIVQDEPYPFILSAIIREVTV